MDEHGSTPNASRSSLDKDATPSPDVNASSESLSTLASPTASFATLDDKPQEAEVRYSDCDSPTIERPEPTASSSVRGSIARLPVPLSTISSTTTWVSRLDTPGGGQLSNVPTRTPSVATQAEEGHNYPPTTSERQMRELPAVDAGRDAYQYLIAATILETIIWGYATSYGVLLDFYLRSDLGRDAGAATILPLVGTVNTGTMYCLSPVMAGLVNRYPASKSPLMYGGLVLAVISLFGASFATTSMQLLLSQGLGYGIGGVILYYPAMSYLPEWFVARRGFANGTIFAGTGFGGLVFPFILEGLLGRFSVATTLRAVAIGMALTIAPCIPFIRPRVPVGKARRSAPTKARTTILGDTAALKDPVLWVFLAANTLQGLSWFLPGLYLPSAVFYLFVIDLELTPVAAYTQSLKKHSSASGSVVLAAMNACSIVSRTGIGILSDRYPPHLIGAVLLSTASVIVFGMWGGAGATGILALIFFAGCFGLSAGGWTSLYFGIIRECSDDTASAITLYGAISLTRGLGNILAAPISSSLLLRRFHAPPGTGFAINGDMFSSLILFCGLSMGAGGLIEAGLATKGRRKRRTA